MMVIIVVVVAIVIVIVVATAAVVVIVIVILFIMVEGFLRFGDALSIFACSGSVRGGGTFCSIGF